MVIARKGVAHSGHCTGGPTTLSGLSESGAHSRPCLLERGGQAGVRVLFGVLVLFGQQVVSKMGHVECVGAQVCVWGWGGGAVAARASAECSALCTTLPGLPFLLPGPLPFQVPSPACPLNSETLDSMSGAHNTCSLHSCPHIAVQPKLKALKVEAVI